MTDNTRTRATRPDLSSAKDDDTKAEIEANTSNSEKGEKDEEPARDTPAASPGDALKRPFSADGATVTDAAGLVICRAGAEHLPLDQRAALAQWIAATLTA